MQFESGHIYHIYNQGNNRQKIFHDRENYLFFLRKIRTHILPFADILAWCLMPNHFHLMVYVNHTEVDEQLIATNNPGPTLSRTRIDTTLAAIPGPTQSRTRNLISFNKSIGIMLASYTRAINNQFNWSGSLFRSETKAVCLTEVKGISPAWVTSMGITQITVHNPDLDYPNVCFNYILNNPVKDKLVEKPEDWEFSSFADYIGNRNGSLISKTRIEEFGLRIL
jgi:putative transposase